MFKNHQRLGLLLSLIFISGCNTNPLPHNLTYTYVPNSENATIFDGYYIPKDIRYNLSDINLQMGWKTSPSVGEQKLLVIPVQLSDGPKWTQKMLDDLEEVFFAPTPKNCYESVSSYFFKSSYGNLSLTGEVLSPLISKLSTVKVNIKGEIAPESIIEDLLKRHDYLNEDIIKEYDTNNDGSIDNAILIYSNEYSASGNGAFWAWSYFYDDDSFSPINNYMWASYEFCHYSYSDNDIFELDSHTYIHEIGHMLGLDDYYSYDLADPWDPAGKLDMQCYNIGDHNAFSKLELGWIKPYVITGPTKIRLKTSSLYPEAILINNRWNGSIFDEYLLIEYYTPKQLNYLDSIYSYENDKMYNYCGLRIYHVDARIVQLEENILGDYTPVSYSDYIKNDDKYTYYIGASNSINKSYLESPYNKKFQLLHLLDQGENNTYSKKKLIDDQTLWTGEKSFSPNLDFFNYKGSFNDKSPINFQISVSELSDVDCLVTISM